MRVTHLWRYPVKSLAGEPLDVARVDHGGFPVDRQYMILDGDRTREGKPLTARQQAALLGFKAAARNGAVVVTAPDGRTFSIDDAFASYLASELGQPLSIETKASGGEPFHDAHDILVINTASVSALEREWGKPLDPLRFRPNIMLEGDDLAAFAENGWPGRSFRVGSAVLAAAELDERCVIPTIDPRTLEKDPSLLRLIVERHEQCFGLYCRVAKAGKIALGDEWLPA